MVHYFLVLSQEISFGALFFRMSQVTLEFCCLALAAVWAWDCVFLLNVLWNLLFFLLSDVIVFFTLVSKTLRGGANPCKNMKK